MSELEDKLASMKAEVERMEAALAEQKDGKKRIEHSGKIEHDINIGYRGNFMEQGGPLIAFIKIIVSAAWGVFLWAAMLLIAVIIAFTIGYIIERTGSRGTAETSAYVTVIISAIVFAGLVWIYRNFDVHKALKGWLERAIGK